jgi:hypothetical protein
MGGQRQAPARPGVALGDLHHRPPEGGQVELVAAEPAGLEHPVEPGLAKLLEQLLRVVAALLGLLGLVANHRLQRLRAPDDLVRGQVRLGRLHLDLARPRTFHRSTHPDISFLSFADHSQRWLASTRIIVLVSDVRHFMARFRSLTPEKPLHILRCGVIQ